MERQKPLVMSAVVVALASILSDANATFAETDWTTSAGLIKTTGFYVPQAELSSGTTSGFFGDSVAMWRDAATGTEWVVAGALSDNGFTGAAYVFSLSPGDTVWRQEAKLIADDAKAGDEFGYSVAIDRDTVVVGAPYHEDNLLIGAAYVFVRDAATGNWHKQDDTLMSGIVRLGTSVAVAGDRLAASGPYCECVQVYNRTSDVWSPDTVITSSEVSLGSDFGSTLAMDGSQLIVGAPGDSTVAAAQGSALIYAASGSSWDLKGVLRPASDTNTFELFGTSVALSGDTAVVGAPLQDHAKGAVHVFAYDGAVWNESQILEAADRKNDAGFGISLTVAANTIAIGSPMDARAYLYGQNGGTWNLISEMSDSAKTVFGGSVAVDGHLFVVGAPGTDADAGHVHVFLNDRIFADGIE